MADITRLLRGRVLAYAACDGTELVLHTAQNAEVRIAWVDHNGNMLKGHPVVVRHGPVLKAEGIRDLIQMPQRQPRLIGVK